MESHNILSTLVFNEHKVLHHLKHFLPAQAPLKDFVHHNLLHFYQHLPFHTALFQASKTFGYKTYLTIQDYRKLFAENKISEDVLNSVIIQYKGEKNLLFWKDALLNKEYQVMFSGRIGKIMHLWKDYYKVNITKYIQPNLFRIISAYLDQGIALVEFPYNGNLNGLLDHLSFIESQTVSSYFFNKNGRACQWLLKNENLEIGKLLNILVGNEKWYADYLFDISFEHPGWSGMVSVLEDHPEYLIKPRKISLKEFIILELLFQIDYLDFKLKEWQPLCNVAQMPIEHLFDDIKEDEAFDVLKMWHDAYEWTYYYQVLNALQQSISAIKNTNTSAYRKKFQTIHCIDDREESFRRYIEQLDKDAETFGTAGFFNMDFWYRPCYSNYDMKLAPAPAQPKHLILEKYSSSEIEEDFNLNYHSHSLLRGWILSQTGGFWAAIQLAGHLLKPHDNPTSVSAKKHMEEHSILMYERSDVNETINGKYAGFTKEEAAEKLSVLLNSIGLTTNFAPLIYIIGHGAGSTNNPYYAAYDCGACSGKPGSVNARVACYFFNDPLVRQILKEKNIHIPDDTVFIPALHGTTSDKIYFYDIDRLNADQLELHKQIVSVFNKALSLNAKERARRFVTMSIKKSPEEIHEMIKIRKFSLFEPRPEYNHATNALCIVGKRIISQKLFLDRRAFLNSYDYQKDMDGKYLLSILKAVSPVCGGINLEYFFSRTDNQKLGAGSKLPHNIYGLISVANGAEGDLRYGLPQQMVEIHDPLRLLLIVEQYPDVIQNTLQQSSEAKEWFDNHWIHLVALHPEENQFYYFMDNTFVPLKIIVTSSLDCLNIQQLEKLFETTSENLQPILIQ